MLPMTVALGASANQDAGMIAVTALVVAQLDRIADEKRQVRTVELVCLAVALACVGAARPPYLALLLMLLPIAPGARGWVALGTAGAAAAFWCGAVALYVMRPLGQTNPAVQISGLLAHPSTILTIVGHTLPLFATSYAWQFIGQLGWNDVPLPLWYRGLAACALGVGVLASRAGPGAWFYHSVAGVFLAICAIFVVQYVDWTAPGTDHVDGVVGRYFIPLALIAGLAVPGGAWGGRAACRLFPIFLVLLALTTPAVMMHHILHHYYISAG